MKFSSLPKAPGKFLQEVWHELRLTEFPARQATLRLTYIVLGTSIIGGIVLLGIDYLFTVLRTALTTVK